nr:hypothetical protein [Chloroflexota bacterium]
MVLQQITGVAASTRVVEATESALHLAAADAGLVVAGLSDRWRQEGLGPARAGLARTSAAPVLFVRRGGRAGLLGPTDDMTRFTWSYAGSGGSWTDPADSTADPAASPAGPAGKAV